MGRPHARVVDTLAATVVQLRRDAQRRRRRGLLGHVKQRAIEQQQLVEEPEYQAIDMPRNSPTGFVTAFFTTVTGFALIWHIWWLVGLGLLGAFVTFVVLAWRDEAEHEIPAAEVARMDRERRRALPCRPEGADMSAGDATMSQAHLR